MESKIKTIEENLHNTSLSGIQTPTLGAQQIKDTIGKDSMKYESKIDMLNEELTKHLATQQKLGDEITITQNELMKKDGVIKQFEKMYEKQKQDLRKEKGKTEKQVQ